MAANCSVSLFFSSFFSLALNSKGNMNLSQDSYKFDLGMRDEKSPCKVKREREKKKTLFLNLADTVCAIHTADQWGIIGFSKQGLELLEFQRGFDR